MKRFVPIWTEGVMIEIKDYVKNLKNQEKHWWYNQANLGDECDRETRCPDAEMNGNCDTCESIDGRWITAVNDYASTCDYCSEPAMHESMLMHEKTQMGLCEDCRRKGITLRVFDVTKKQFIKEWAQHEGCVTSWPLNLKVLEYGREYYGDSWSNKSRKNLIYEFNKLVKTGFLDKSHRVGLGFDAVVELGYKYQTYWNIKP